MTSLRLLIVDDQALFREGLASLLGSQEDITVVGQAGDGIEAVELVRALQPDLVLMDVNMPQMNGLEATREILRESPSVRIVILTVSDDDDDLFAAIKAGAVGYLLKNMRADSLFERLRGAIRGEAALSPILAARVLEEFARQRQPENSAAKPPSESSELSVRERSVLQLVINGASNREIAAELDIAESTVKRHLHNILEKLHLENRIQAAAYAMRKGLIDPPRDDPSSHGNGAR